MSDDDPTRARRPADDAADGAAGKVAGKDDPTRVSSGWPQARRPPAPPQQPTAGPLVPPPGPPAARPSRRPHLGGHDTPPGAPPMGYPFTMPAGQRPSGPLTPPPSWTPSGLGQPPRRPGGTGRTIGLVALAIVLIAGLGVGAFWLTRHTHGSSTAADPTSPTSPAPTSSVPTTPATSSPSATTPSTSQPRKQPTKKPTSPETSLPPITGPISFRDYGSNWNFRFGGVALRATYTRGHDFKTCSAITGGASTLNDLGCRSASVIAFRARDNQLAITQLILTAGTKRQATNTASKVTFDDLRLDQDAWLAPQGRYEINATGSYVVITLVTHTPRVRQATASEYLRYKQSDLLGALAFRS